MSLSKDKTKRIEEEEKYREEIRVKLERDKLPIEEEEIYRQKIRAKLEKDKPSRMWAYVNSPIALWALSSVIVALISFAYSKHLDSVKKEEERNERSQKLEAEINNRRNETLKFLKYFKARTNGAKYYDDPRFLYKEAVTFMDGKNDPDFPAFQSALYQEFKQENLNALLTELEKVSETKATDIKSLRTKYDALASLYSQTEDRPAKDPNNPTKEEKRINVEGVDKAINILDSK
jgi:hypothetical protein